LLLNSERVRKHYHRSRLCRCAVLDYGLSDVRPEGSVHSRQGAPDLAAGARDRKVQDRLDRKMRTRRHTMEHPFGTIKEWMRHALPDEKIAESCERNGAARAGSCPGMNAPIFDRNSTASAASLHRALASKLPTRASMRLHIRFTGPTRSVQDFILKSLARPGEIRPSTPRFVVLPLKDYLVSVSQISFPSASY
jgi:hypothetical protein